MEGLSTGKKIETIEAGNPNMEAQKRIAEMFGEKVTPEQVLAHGILAERN
jgi:hypothetical protein